MDLAKSRVKIGLEKPVRVLHITDTHFCFSDLRDSEKTQEMVANFHVRHKVTPEGLVANFREAVDYANECCDLLVHSGDLIFILAHLSLEKAREELERSKNYTMIAGNHEFSRFCGEAWEDKSYMMDSYPLVRTLLGNDLLFTSKIVGGVNFVGIYNGYYQLEDWQTERLRREAAKGLPIVLFMHVPMFEQTLYDKTFEMSHGTCFWLMGCDEDHLLPLSEHRAVQERPDDPTKRFIDYVHSQPLIRCVLSGHVHFHHESILPGGSVQYVTKAGFNGGAREIIFE